MASAMCRASGSLRVACRRLIEKAIFIQRTLLEDLQPELLRRRQDVFAAAAAARRNRPEGP